MDLITTRDEVLTHWTIQETLLQSYRSIFITAQSVIFSIGALFVSMEDSKIFAFFPLLAIGLVLRSMWVSICRARGHDVSFCQMILMKIENGESLTHFMTKFKEWQSLTTERKEKILSESGHASSLTRKKMEYQLPLFFLILWVCLTGILLLS